MFLLFSVYLQKGFRLFPNALAEVVVDVAERLRFDGAGVVVVDVILRAGHVVAGDGGRTRCCSLESGTAYSKE